jgi:hypothetical protein
MPAKKTPPAVSLLVLGLGVLGFVCVMQWGADPRGITSPFAIPAIVSIVSIVVLNLVYFRDGNAHS